MHSIDELRDIFLQHLQNARFTSEPKNLYEPNNYFLGIGGKRLRPVLLLLSTEIFGGNVTDAMNAALAIEFFHNFTLIHDDVMDDAPLRRNFETIHQKYNLNTAILSGDVLMVKACEYLGKLDDKYFRTCFDIFTKTAIEVCDGQQYDIDFESKQNVTHVDYIEMIRLKTSVLLAASMKIGAIIGNANNEDADLMYEYAENLGIAFQIQDDILDCFGDEKLVGKQPGGDIIQNKKTLLLIEALERSKTNNDNQLTQIITDKHIENHQKINSVLKIFDQYKIKEFAVQQRNSYVEKSVKALAKINLDNTKKDVLKSLVDYLVVRDF
ncbi:MAG: polyprenyl synthetase family protein [Saprospirales bacterium]|nr:polyprenyl synthetase family protein [Saprospirales bacterium]